MGMRKVTMSTGNNDKVTRIVDEDEAARLGREPFRPGSNIVWTTDVPADADDTPDNG